MNNMKFVWGGILIAMVIAFGGYYFPQIQQVAHNAGGVLDYEPFDFFVATQGYWSGVPNGKTPSDSNGQLTSTSVGACSTASSTLFAVQNPFNGTNGFANGTTTAYITLYGNQGATTTDILVGTSTVSAVAASGATSTLAETLVGAFGVPTSSPFYISSGNTNVFPRASALTGSTNLYVNNSEIVVGVSQYLLGFSTSTYLGGANTGGNGAGQVSTPASCTYKIVWYR